MCRSRVPTTYAYDDELMCAVMAAATAAPPETARLPPSQKSFCTSTTTSARVMASPCHSGRHGLQGRLPTRERPRLLRQRRPYLLVVGACLGQRRVGRRVAGALATPHQRDDQITVARTGLDRRAADH